MKIKFKNFLGTIESFIRNDATVARTYQFQNRDGVIADDTDLALKAPIASPTFTGTPAGPTAAPGTNTTQLATAAFVQAAISALVNSSPGALDTLNELAAALGNDANFAATVTAALASKAPTASPTFTGTVSFPAGTIPKIIQIAFSDSTSAITAGASKVTFRMPYEMTVTGVRISLKTAQSSGSIFTVDVNEAGVSILSTKLTIDNAEKTSTTAATPAVISDTALADDAEISVDVDQIGDGTAIGGVVTIIGY